MNFHWLVMRRDCRQDFWTLWEKVRVGCFERTASKHVYYLGWNRSPAQVGCMRQVLGPGTLGRPRRIGWRGRWEGGSGWGIHVNPWLIHVNVWQKPLQYCKVISLQLIKINGKKILKNTLRRKMPYDINTNKFSFYFYFLPFVMFQWWFFSQAWFLIHLMVNMIRRITFIDANSLLEGRTCYF